MFVRKKKNRSGSMRVVVVDKSSGHFQEVKTIGISFYPNEIEQICQTAQEWIHGYAGQLDLFVSEEKETAARIEKAVTFQVLRNVEHILIIGEFPFDCRIFGE
jgi:hypothetical protein